MWLSTQHGTQLDRRLKFVKVHKVTSINKRKNFNLKQYRLSLIKTILYSFFGVKLVNQNTFLFILNSAILSLSTLPVNRHCFMQKIGNSLKCKP